MSQRRSSTLSSIGKRLFLTEEFKDLTVVVPTETSQFKFPAHRLILASGSSVLKAMLEDENVSELVFDDLSPSTVELLLRFIYQGELELDDWNEAINLLTAAYKYKVKDLVQKCGKFLEKVITLSNVCQVYNEATTCSLSVFQDKCLNLILDAGFIVLKSDGFEQLHRDCVMDIVASSELNIDSELSVFETLFRWARMECCNAGLQISDSNILTQIKPFLQYVCIDDMSDADKSALPPMILSCVKPNNRNRISFSVLDSLLKLSQRLEFDMNKNSLDFIGEKISCLRFSVDDTVHLIGIEFTFVASVISMTLSLTLIKENNPKSTLFHQCVCSSSIVDSSQVNQRLWQTAEIRLKQPVALKAGDIYNVCASDCETDHQCPRISLPNSQLFTYSGIKNFTLHADSEDIRGITSLIVI